MSLLATLIRRWDIDPVARAHMTFDATIALLNVRRLELAGILLLANDAIETWLWHIRSVQIEMAVAVVTIVVSLLLRRHGDQRLYRALVNLGIIEVMATTIWTSMVLTTSDDVPTGYIMRLLTITLLFVVPPRTWAALLYLSYAGFAASLAVLPMEAWPRYTAIINGAIVVGIVQVTGWLIYSVRRTDHEQRVQIVAQNELLAAQNAELDQLMAITAHDLRSPLYGLRNLLDLAQRRAVAEPTLPLRVLGDGIAGVDSMLALVTRLLDAHQAEHAPLGEAGREDLRDHVQAAARRIAPRADAGAVRIDLRLPGEALCARVDPGALAHILDNLLDNAVRFSPPGSALGLTAAVSGPHAAITIEDRGPGVDPAVRATMFGKFRRGASAAGAKPGAGMGLFIAATFAARIGAILSYRPAKPTGAVFELSLPLAPAAI